MQIPASYCKIEELPSPTRKPLCEHDLHRRIRSFFLGPRGPQSGLDEYRQGINIKRLANRWEASLALPVLGAKRRNPATR